MGTSPQSPLPFLPTTALPVPQPGRPGRRLPSYLGQSSWPVPHTSYESRGSTRTEAKAACNQGQWPKSLWTAWPPPRQTVTAATPWNTETTGQPAEGSPQSQLSRRCQGQPHQEHSERGHTGTVYKLSR